MRPLLKIHGGKFYLKNWVISLFPENYEKLAYVEPCIGGGSVFLNKTPSLFETICDINEGVVDAWTLIKEDVEGVKEYLSQISYSQETFDRWLKNTSPISMGLREIILSRMSRGGLKERFAWSERIRNGKPGDVNAWDNFVSGLDKFVKRIEHVNISLINILDIEFIPGNFLYYIDPPYLHSTRTKKRCYTYEFTTKNHLDLLDKIKDITGCKILISGYDSEIYNNELKNWNRFEKQIVNHSGQNKKKELRTEIIWRNF